MKHYHKIEMKLQIKHPIIPFILFIFFIIACHHDTYQSDCPGFDWLPISPYESPLCHPSGLIIGFNHIPIEEIFYGYGYDCPRQANYIYDGNDRGFWLMNSDGSNMRKVLPYYLGTPTWSPDGNWIAFSRNGNIFKIPFNGESLDTSAIIQLTTCGMNYYPAWSTKGNLIAYDNTNCGTSVSPAPENSCGILIIDPFGNNSSFVIGGGRRFPYWGNATDTIYYGLFSFDLINRKETTIFDTKAARFSTSGRPLYNPLKDEIFFLGKFDNTPDPIRLYSIKPSGQGFKLISNEEIKDFTITPEGKVIYLLFNGYRITENQGTLWCMDGDGSNKIQLTFNEFKISIK